MESGLVHAARFLKQRDSSVVYDRGGALRQVLKLFACQNWLPGSLPELKWLSHNENFLDQNRKPLIVSMKAVYALGAAVLNEDKIIIAIEKFWLLLDAVNGLLWFVTGLTAAVLFIAQACLSNGEQGFIVVCCLLGGLALLVAFSALIVMLISTSLLFNLFSVARLLLEARCKAFPIPPLKLCWRLSIAYCFESEGQSEDVDRVYESVEGERELLRYLSPLSWSVAFDAFAEWLDKKRVVIEKDRWVLSWERSQLIRRCAALALFAASIVSLPLVVIMLPGLAESFATPRIANYPAAVNVLSIFIHLEHMLQPENKFMYLYRAELAQYQIQAGQYAAAEATLRLLIVENRRHQINDANYREHIRWLCRLLDEESGHGQYAESLYKQSMSSLKEAPPRNAATH